MNLHEHHPATSEFKRHGFARLHWIHWCVVAASLVLTLLAWSVAKRQLDDKVKSEFDREADQVIELVPERMQKYEDALWGVGAIQTLRTIDNESRIAFSRTLSIESTYARIDKEASDTERMDSERLVAIVEKIVRSTGIKSNWFPTSIRRQLFILHGAVDSRPLHTGSDHG